MRGILLKCTVFFGIFSYFVTGSIFCQEMDLQDRLVRIQKVQNTIHETFNFNYNEISRIAIEKRIPLTINLENFNKAQLQYFDSDGFPVYFNAYNLGAAFTTKTSSLQTGGNLNLNLSGLDLLVGVWDQDASKADHIEFGNRVSRRDGATEFSSAHGTHVMGTILAAGVNNSAKGMAVGAKGNFYDWINDLAEMLDSAFDPVLRPNGNLISNHSYGNATGWENQGGGVWKWFGNESISKDEDYRFGFYNSKSKSLDDIAYEFPYYSIFWAAGNDRSDVGDGTRPPDGPDDTINPEGSAKNVFTIGAVGEVENYSGPNSISMSSFSSWGPTDDGRIKPDVVGMGIGVFSSYFTRSGETISDSYTNLNGTSMASPNVAGSLLLLQDLYRNRYNGTFMKSATLKALSIHTAREAGNAPGPDYIFGWGLVDVESAAKLILNEDGANIQILEEKLINGQNFEFDFETKNSNLIKVTLAWTDPSGTPVAASLDPQNLMLVNDLDLRIINEDGQIFYPWSLDPSKGSNATAINSQDNFRDNVEQILIPSPDNKRFKLQISHKGALVNGSQFFSLVFEAITVSGSEETLYWIGKQGGNWNDGSNWSTTTGGVPADRMPTSGTRVVFDQNSFGDAESIISVNSNIEVNSFNYFVDKPATIKLGENLMKISNGFQISSDKLIFEGGTIQLDAQNNGAKTVDLGKSNFSSTSISVENGEWNLTNPKSLNSLHITNSSDLEVTNQDYSLNELHIDTGAVVNFSNTNISGLSILNSNLPSFEMGNSNIIEFSGQNSTLNVVEFSVGNINISSEVALKSTGKVSALNLGMDDGNLEIDADWNVTTLNSSGSLSIGFASGIALNVEDDWVFEDLTSLTFAGSGSESSFNLGFRKIICLPNSVISNVNLGGVSIVSVGISSEVINSTGWLKIPCDQLVLADFDFKYACLDSYAEFNSTSEGPIDEFLWTIDGQTYDSEEFVFLIRAAGTYELELTVSNEFHSNSITTQIDILENDIRKPEIVVNGNVLASTASGTEYKWYLNGEIIEGQSGRTLEVSGDGIYQVAVFGTECNRVSESIVISSIPNSEPELLKYGVAIGPNPVEMGFLNISVTNGFSGNFEVQIIDALGRLVGSEKLDKNQELADFTIDFNYKPGLYFVRFSIDKMIFTKKIIKR